MPKVMLSVKCQSFSLKRYMALGIISNKQIKGTLVMLKIKKTYFA